jgi:sialate O-acetylesterase
MKPQPFPARIFLRRASQTVWVGLLLGALARLPAAVTPAALFQDHAVLQAGKPVRVWGHDAAGQKISVAFAGQQVSAETGPEGTWSVLLAPLTASAEGRGLTIAGSSTVELHDIVVGEVWLCSGQSNMEFPLNQAASADAEIAAANLPLIRQFLVRRKLANAPQPDVTGAWTVSSSVTAGSFTAVGYFFARELSQRLGVPVGLINSTWGGTDIESWMSSESIRANPALGFVNTHWQQQLDRYAENQAQWETFEATENTKLAEANARGETYTKRWHSPVALPDGTPHPNKPSNLYHGMIQGLTPAALAGVLWYQGENNAGRADEYRQLFPVLITGWRRAFGAPELPFYWVQLPNYRGNPTTEDWVALREAQSAALALPATAQAVTIDVGELTNIHPRNKLDVGHRLALLALRDHYGQKIAASGPRFERVEFQGAVATVHFAEVAGGLKYKGEKLLGFEAAGNDRIFHPAQARIDGDTVRVQTPDVPAPVAVRYAWHNFPDASLSNPTHLPAIPFRTDAW